MGGYFCAKSIKIAFFLRRTKESTCIALEKVYRLKYVTCILYLKTRIASIYVFIQLCNMNYAITISLQLPHILKGVRIFRSGVFSTM